MIAKKIVFALGVCVAACSGSGVATKGAATASVRDCAGGFAWSDAELARYRGCDSISADLFVSGVSSLEPLASLRSVEGTLSIDGTTRLYSLAGLGKLERVGALEIFDNRALISAGGLAQLAQVERVLISGNPRLSGSFGLLPRVDRARAHVSIEQNAGLRAEGVFTTRSSVASERLAGR